MITTVLAFSCFFIIYGIYTFVNLNQKKDEKIDVQVETGDRPLKQEGLVIYLTEKLSLREEANTDSKRLAYIPDDTKLDVIEELDGWYKVTYNGKTGWIAKKYTTTQAPAEDPTKAWPSYVNNQQGYKIQYQPGWKYQDYGANATAKILSVIAFSANDLPGSLPQNSDFVAPITISVTGKTLADANKELSNISGVVIEPMKVGAYPATKYTYVSPLSNTQMTGIVFSAGGKTFMMNEGGGYLEDLIKMANTFTIGV